MKHIFVFFAFFFLISASTFKTAAQGKLRINLDASGETYIKAGFRTQLWFRYTEMNPGSGINGEATENFFDVSMRRLRIPITAQLSKKLYVSALFGENNLNYISNQSFRLHLLDMYAEYAFHPAFTLGGGKSAWQGLSRWNFRSSGSMMALDAPLFVLNTVNRIDDLGRNFGVYFKGQAGKWDYRVVFNTPNFFSDATPAETVEFAHNRPRIKSSAYLKYQFLEKESNKSAYSTGTYVGKKDVLNVGVGFMQQPKALWSSPVANNDTLFHDLSHWAVDVFYDHPINKENNTAITAYLGYFSTGFGPNYIRNVGASNPATGTVGSGASYNGAGNAFPMMGTGNTFFFQFGYLLGKNLLGEPNGQLQPNLAVQYADFDKLADPVLVYDLGVNWYFDGHKNKFTLGYQSRPIFTSEAGGLKATSRRGMVVLQYTIEIY